MRTSCIASVCCTLLFVVSSPAVEPVEWVLREPLDRDWPAEWVSFEVDLPAGGFHEGQMAVSGADGEVEHSIAILTRYEDGSVQKAKVWVRTGLKRGETKIFRVVPAGRPDPATSVEADRPHDQDERHLARLSNGLVSLELVKPRVFDPPVEARADLAPIQAVGRPRTVLLRGRMAGLGKVKAIVVSDPLSVSLAGRDSREDQVREGILAPACGGTGKCGTGKCGTGVSPVQAGRMPAPQDGMPAPLNGPVAAPSGILYEQRREIRYQLADGGEYVVRVRLIAHEPAVLVEEDFNGVTAPGWLLDFRAGLNPTMGQGRFHRPTGLKLKGGRDGYPLDPDVVDNCQVQPFYAWWPDFSTWWAAYRPGGDYVGVFATRPSEWLHPGGNRIQIRTGGEHGVQAFFPLQKGTRRWGIVVAPADEALQRSPGGANLVHRMMIRLCENPLDRVKDLPLRWPGRESIRYPHLLCRPDDIAAIREKARTHPLFARVLNNFPEAPEDPVGLYLATGDETCARRAIDELKTRLSRWVEQALDGDGYLNGVLVAIPFTRPLRTEAIAFDLLAGSKSMTDAERDYLLRVFAFLAHVLADENRWPPRHQGFHRGNVNFHSDDYTCLATVAALLTGHPDQKRWMDYVEREMRLEFEKCVSPGGAWCEAPNYQGYTIHYLIIAMRAMQLNGFADFAGEPRLRETMDYFFRIQTPYDVRAGRHLLPTVGDTTAHYHSQSLQNVFAWAAALFEDDPALAGRMMHAWRRGGSVLFGAHGLGFGQGWTQPLLFVDPTIPEVPPEKPLESERLPGYGALLRNGYGTPRESYFLFKMGPIDQHFDSDEGSFHWYALGMPLSLDFGCMYVPSIEQPWLHSTLDFDRQRIWTQGEITDFASFDGFDYCAGRLCARHFQRVPDLPEQGAPGSIRGRAPCVDWRRQILFVKGPDYIVMRDDVDDPDRKMPTGWHLQVLASSAELAGQRARFIGQHDVDLDVLMAEPAGVALTTSEWGYAGKPAPAWAEEKPMPPMDERQIALHAPAEPSGDYLAVMFPYQHGEPAPEMERLAEGVLRVRHPAGEDTIFFAREPGRMRAGDIEFTGRVGLVRRQGDTVELFIAEGTHVRVAGRDIACDAPAAITVGE